METQTFGSNGNFLGWLSQMGAPVGLNISVGRVFFADPGSLAPLSVRSNGNWYSTLEAAYAQCTAGEGDIVYLIGGPSSTSQTASTVRLAAAFDWAKNNTHLIGLCAPTMVGQRARITGPASGGTFSPLFTVSGSGCRFENLNFFDDYTVDPCAIKVTGQRNYFANVNIQGMGAQTGADDANGSSLWIAAGAENTFDGCTIGLDTVPRSTTNGEIRLTAAATRNVFRGCHIVSESSNAGHLFVKASSNGDLDRYTSFENCIFYNAPTGIAGGTTMTQAMNIASAAGGYVILHRCTIIGATDVAAADNGNVFGGDGAPTAGTSELAVAVTR